MRWVFEYASELSMAINYGTAFISMQVAILNGITMGGGAGVSIPGTFRLATDKTVWNRH